MYIALITSKEEDMVSSIYDKLLEQFPNLTFSKYEMSNRGTQIRLEGNSDETEPQKFVNEYVKIYTKLKKKLEEKQ